MTDGQEVALQHIRGQKNLQGLGGLVHGAVNRPPELFVGFPILHKTLTMISAEPFTGKTMLLSCMMLCLDGGAPLFGFHDPLRPISCLFIGQDAPTWDYKGQVQKLARGLALPESTEFDSDMLLNEGVNLMDKNFIKWVYDYHEVTGFEVLMLDTLASLHSLNENDNQQMGMLMGRLKSIRDDLKVAVMFTHHTAKLGADAMFTSGNYRSRGASTIAGSCDFHVQLSAAAGKVKLVMPKGRGAGSKPAPWFEIVEEGDAVKLTIPHSESLTEMVVKLLGGGAMSRSTLLDHTRKTGTALDNALQYLKRSGKVTLTKGGSWRLVQ